jgi:hypothetical protein
MKWSWFNREKKIEKRKGEKTKWEARENKVRRKKIVMGE